MIFKRKYIFNAFNTKKLQAIKEKHNKNKIISSSAKNINIHYQNNFYKYSEFYKRTLRAKMLRLSKGNTKDKLKALKIAEELADKSTLPILRKGLKDMNLKIVERSADLITKFK
tara:strand:- start:324 stop:665 length:342 start_codon:yes stop_codon:yes gene_type:complete